MSDFAVIKIGGSQYIISEGDKFEVDKLKDPKKLDFNVLLLSKAGKVSVGKPELKDAKVKLKVLEEMVKGDKLRVFKYKAKSRYRKTKGFRPLHTILQVDKIGW